MSAVGQLKAPFPYFGGKSAVSHIIWDRLGDPANFVEPFAGSLAVLLGRPGTPKTETCNDADGFISNVWRAIQYAPHEVAHYCDWPVMESDMHAKHHYLNAARAELTQRLEGNYEYFDAKLAGFWIWGQCLSIAGGWCSGKGPWRVVDGLLKRVGRSEGESGVERKLPHLGNAGTGVAKASLSSNDALYEWMDNLSSRLRRVRIACGDWTRVLSPAITFKHGMTGIFLDPPYGHSERRGDIYAHDNDVAQDVLAWCLENGANPLLRICLAGYDGEHNALEGVGWERVGWKTNGGYGNKGKEGRGRENAARESLWFSPACLKPDAGLFGGQL